MKASKRTSFSTIKHKNEEGSKKSTHKNVFHQRKSQASFKTTKTMKKKRRDNGRKSCLKMKFSPSVYSLSRKQFNLYNAKSELKNKVLEKKTSMRTKGALIKKK